MAPDYKYHLLGLQAVGDFGATIALPAVVLSWLGKRLDEAWGTRPALLIAGFALAALLSSYAVYRKAKAYDRRFQELNSADR